MKAAIVAGTVMMVLAKMTGMTPAILTFMGRWVDWPPYILRPTTRFGVLHRNAALGIGDRKR